MFDVEVAEVDNISMYCKTSNGGCVSIDFSIKDLYADGKPDIRLSIEEDKEDERIIKKRACLSFPYSDVVLNFLDAVELALRRQNVVGCRLMVADDTKD